MKMSKFYMPTLKEDPVEAEVKSHKLLLRAGMIRRSASGIYSYLPLGYRVVRKIEELVREEMDNCGSQEILMSAIQPKEIWEESGRWSVYGPEMFKLKDRHNRDFCLGPTAEEYFTTLIKGEIRSYKQLPLTIYQIQTKYRDEKRPRFGINRAREFLMKDAYSFDIDEESSNESYMVQWKAYEKIFDRLGLEYKIVRGDSGAMGGDKSHEFIALSDVGEGEIAYCNSCEYAATDEKAEVVCLPKDEDKDMDEMKEVYTPEAKTIALLAEAMGVSRKQCCKAIDL
ncbi:MAG: proline--tRNA ligase, partial [Tissierellia bacterium]|nr:proline--tRNA ligase [Tissierellia bacterium]